MGVIGHKHLGCAKTLDEFIGIEMPPMRQTTAAYGSILVFGMFQDLVFLVSKCIMGRCVVGG